MKTKTNSPRSAGSIATILAVTFFTLSVVILLMSSGLAIIFNYTQVQETVSVRQLLIAQNAAKTVSKFIQDKFNDMEIAVELVNPVSVGAETQKNIMESLLGHDPAFRQLALLDRQGRQLAHSSRILQTLSPQFIAQLKGDSLTETSKGERYVSPVYIDDVTSEPLVAIAIPVKNVFGDFQGTLVSEVNLKFMWDLVDQLKVGETGYAYVVDNQGNLIAFGDASRVLRGENVGKIFEVQEFVKSPSASDDISPEVESYTGLLDANVVGTYVPLGTPQWAVIIELPTDEAYQPLAGVVMVSIIATLILAALAGTVGIFVARRLAVPLVNLTETATRIANGEMGLQAVPSGTREIVGLATAFNSMTGQLRDLIGSLEQRVADRTKVLAKQALQLQSGTDVSRAVSSVLDADELIQKAVNLVRDRFDLYYVGLFLLDEQHHFAVLEAGTGEAGRHLLENAHKLEVNDDSMIGWCITHKQARIALDADKESARFSNPLLPNTHSELALPLISRGQVIGAMTVQSEHESAFADEDVTILQTMADQLANGIEKARLYEQIQQRSAELTRQQYILDTFMDNIPDIIYFKDSQSRITRTNRAFALRIGAKDTKELIGKSDFDFFPSDQAEIKFQQEQEIIKTGQPILNLEELDGIDRWALTTKMPLRDETGAVIGTFGISHDITELVKAKWAAEASVEEADKARALAEIERAKAEKAHYEVEIANQTLGAQMWQTAGQALLNEKMRGEQDIPTLANNVINQLCNYLDVQIGALYVKEMDVLKVAGTYANKHKNLAKEFQLGEGLVGQAALEKKSIIVNVPEDYIPIASSSLGKIVPRHVLFTPFVYDQQVIGVIEMGKLAELTPAQMDFLEKAVESVAIAFMTAQARTRVNELFSQTRQQAQELQAQEEELRAANEELEAQAESLRDSKSRLKPSM